MFGAYALTLAALEIAEAAPVAALRETSVVMATAAAAVAGRERVPAAAVGGGGGRGARCCLDCAVRALANVNPGIEGEGSGPALIDCHLCPT